MREQNHNLDFKTKTVPITLRIDENELQQLKNISKENGIPYATLIKSLIFRFNRNLINFM
ncbi:CopG family antitoxin [Pseudofrancisella aestuarii]|uniref:CopG family antitoxin n=1 Tax=Pseudofrancisella aestuarii TaxID=2670347 RepID=A0ABV9TDP6_9GAMM|nr:CopG family antitoxin [Pseudofrancisella aestuarii]